MCLWADTGSQFLGYITACLAILVTQHESNALSPVLPLYIVGLPILDTLLVICIRKMCGRPVFVADNSHIHHQLMHIGFQQYEVVAILYAIQAVFVLLAWNLRYASDTLLMMVLSAILPEFCRPDRPGAKKGLGSAGQKTVSRGC